MAKNKRTRPLDNTSFDNWRQSFNQAEERRSKLENARSFISRVGSKSLFILSVGFWFIGAYTVLKALFFLAFLGAMGL